MDIPLLGTALPVQIIDNSLPGHTITQVSTSINDVSALEAYLQTSLSTFTRLYYYPDQPILQIQTLGDTADATAIQSLMKAYPNPEPFISTTVDIGMAPISASSGNWKTVFVLNSPCSDDKKLSKATISSALTPTSPNELPLSNLQYSVRVVAIDTNTILGVISACNAEFETQDIELTNVPANSAFSLEFQIRTQGAYATLRSISLTYQLL